MTNIRPLGPFGPALVLALVAPQPVHSQPPLGVVPPSALNIDTLLASPGPSWVRGESRHFVVYAERDIRRTEPRVLLDSLEAAWDNTVALIGSPVADGPPITVLVTASRTRFPLLVSPHGKGLATTTQQGRDLIILVRNDTVRAHTRHEVMHVVARRAWRWTGPDRAWLVEGLAVFADGQCQGLPLSVVARDLLRQRPNVTVRDVTERFLTDDNIAERATAYVLAGSLVDYLWSSRGREGVRRLWAGTDTLPRDQPGMAAFFATDITSGWRACVERAAGARPALDQIAFRRFGCG